MQYFPVKFHFLNNDKSYKRDFFTIDTIDDGYLLMVLKVPISRILIGQYHRQFSEWHVFVYRASWSDQRARPARE